MWKTLNVVFLRLTSRVFYGFLSSIIEAELDRLDFSLPESPS